MKEHSVAVLLAVLLIVILVGAVGFAIHVLWFIAVVLLVLWLLGFLFRAGAGSGRRRWYRW